MGYVSKATRFDARRPLTLALGLLAAMLVFASSASAGTIVVHANWRGDCQDCHFATKFRFLAYGPDEINIAPQDKSIAWSQGDSMYSDFGLVGAPLNYTDVTWSSPSIRYTANLGNFWSVIMCRVDKCGTAGDVISHTGYFPSDTTEVMPGGSEPYNGGYHKARFILRHTASAETHTYPNVQAHAKDIFWTVTDNQPPQGVGLAVGGTTDPARVVFNAADSSGSATLPLSVAAGADNTGLGGQSLTSDGAAISAAAGLGNGDHNLVWSVNDIATPANVTRVTRHIVFDSGVPVVGVPAQGPFTSQRPTFSATAVDPTVGGYASGLTDTATLWVDGKPTPATVSHSGPDYRLTPETNLAYGSHDVSMSIGDGVGNVAGPGSGAPVTKVYLSNPAGPPTVQAAPVPTPVAGRKGSAKPRKKHGKRLRVVIAPFWTWTLTKTYLANATISQQAKGAKKPSKLAKNAVILTTCRGKKCFHGPVLSHSADGFVKALRGRALSPGTRLTVSIFVPGHTPTRFGFKIRAGRIPTAKALK